MRHAFPTLSAAKIKLGASEQAPFHLATWLTSGPNNSSTLSFHSNTIFSVSEIMLDSMALDVWRLKPAPSWFSSLWTHPGAPSVVSSKDLRAKVSETEEGCLWWSMVDITPTIAGLKSTVCFLSLPPNPYLTGS